jgi:hypothetical protein
VARFFLGGGVLNACVNVATLEEGTPFITKSFKVLGSYVFVGNSLMDMYAKCGNMEDAWVCSTRCHLKMQSFGLP